MEYLKEIGIQFIIIPLFGESNLDNKDSSLIKNLNILVSKAESLGMNILIESDIDTNMLLNILSQIDNPSLGMVYDVGNATFSGKNINYDLDLLSEKIFHVHLKDKDRNGRNVLLGRGLVDFTNFFKLLIEYDYNGSFTLETSRGKEALLMAKKNLEFIRSNFRYDAKSFN
jgi:sugar phosphate isomerase/epimerase